MKTKTVRDADSHTHSANLYALGELAQNLIRTRAKSHTWSVESYPGRVRLPMDILKPLPNPEAVSKIVKTVYLPDSITAWLAERSKTGAEKVRETVVNLSERWLSFGCRSRRGRKANGSLRSVKLLVQLRRRMVMLRSVFCKASSPPRLISSRQASEKDEET